MDEMDRLIHENARLKLLYESALKLNVKREKQYSELLDRVQKMVMGLGDEQLIVAELYEELKEKTKYVQRLQEMVVTLYGARDEHFGSLWQCLDMTHEEFQMWKDANDVD